MAIALALTLSAAPDVTGGGYAISPPIDTKKYYPKDAQTKGVSGHTTVECLLDSELYLKGCRVIEETPADQGFGKASLRAVGSSHLKSVPGGPKADTMIQVPIVWTPSK